MLCNLGYSNFVFTIVVIALVFILLYHNHKINNTINSAFPYTITTKLHSTTSAKSYKGSIRKSSATLNRKYPFRGKIVSYDRRGFTRLATS